MLTRGFTLVELLVTLALAGLLALVALPLTSNWIKDAQIVKDLATFKLGMNQAKAAAMRNKASNFSTDVNTDSAKFCRNGGNVYTFIPSAAGTAASCESGVDSALFKGKWGDGVEISLGTIDSGTDDLQAGAQTICGASFDYKGSIKFCTLNGTSCNQCNLSLTSGKAVKFAISGGPHELLTDF